MALTEERKQQYVADGGTKCPYCESHDIEGSFVEINVGSGHQRVRCAGCGKVWTDFYELIDMEEDEETGDGKD